MWSNGISMKGPRLLNGFPRRAAALLLGSLLLAGCEPVPEADSAAPAPPPVTHLGPGFWDDVLDPYVAWQEANREAGFDFELYLSAIAQRGSQPWAPNRLLNSSADLYLQWNVNEDPTWGSGSVASHAWHIQEYLGGSAWEFAAAQGTTIHPNDDSGPAHTALASLYWQQEGMLDGALDVQVGALCPSDIFDDNTYANWDRESFLAQPLAGNPTRVWPSTGLGVLGRLHPSEFCEITAAVLDGNGTDRGPDLGAFGDRRMARIAEVAFKPEIPGLGPGVYRFTWQSVDASLDLPPGEGFLASFQQDTGEDAALVLRYGRNTGTRTEAEEVLAGGVVFTAPFGYEDDWIGIGAIRSRPTDPTLRDDFALEAYWRMQLTRHLHLTPDLQFHVQTSNPDEDPLVTGGMRMTLSL